MTAAPVAFIVGLDRVGGHVCAARVRCPWCSRIHVHRWPVRGTVSPQCGTPRAYAVTFWHTEMLAAAEGGA